QNKAVKGIVKDVQGNAIPGASVLERGTNNSTVTDVSGSFSINVKDDAVLVVRFIGFGEVQIPVSGRTSVSVVLRDSAEDLQEIIVVGYGVQKKESVVGAISQISAKDLLK